MKAGWVKKKLGDVATKIGSGATPLGGKEAYKADGIALIRSLNVYDDGFREAKLARIDDQQADRLSNVIVESNDVLLNITGASVARCCIAPTDFLPARVNQHVSIIRPVRGNLDPAFLHYLLTSKTYKDRLLHVGEEGGSTRQAITKAQLQDFFIEYPESLPEQQRIVGILDQAFDGIATAKANFEANLQNARALFESHLQSVFTQRGEGWVEKRLGDIAEVQSGGTPLVSNKSFWGGDIPWYSSGELNDLHTTAPGRHITTAGLNGSNTKLFPKGSLLIGMYDTAALKMSILERDAAFNQAIAGVRPNKHVDLIFVLHAINAVKPFILSQRRGVRQKNLSLTKIKEITLNLPPLSEQQAIVSRLDDYATETQRLESLYQQKLAALSALKQSLLHQAFSGQLTIDLDERIIA